MGNHIHLLIKEEQEGLDQIFRRIGSRFVYWYNAKYEREGHLFQDRYKAEPIDSEEYLFTVIRYIHQNPVKAGLCKGVDEYEFSSYAEFMTEEKMTDTKDIFTLISKESFIEIHKKPVIIDCLDIANKHACAASDEQAKTEILKISGCKNLSDFQAFETDARNSCLKRLKDEGYSIRQLSRLTGIGYSIIQRA